MMEIYLIYFLKVIVLQTILFGLYWLINRRSTNFHFNRYFLLAILVLPFITPLFRIPVFILGQDSTAEGTFDPWFFIEQSLPIVTIKGSQSLSSDVTKWTFLIVIIYLTVAFVSAIKTIWGFLRTRKKWWLTPIIIMLLLLGAIMVFAQSSVLAPFIYAIF